MQKAHIEKTLLSSKIEHDRVQRELARQQDQSRDHTQFKETLDRQEMELRTLQHNLQRQKLDAHERSLYAETLMTAAQALEQKVLAEFTNKSNLTQQVNSEKQVLASEMHQLKLEKQKLASEWLRLQDEKARLHERRHTALKQAIQDQQQRQQDELTTIFPALQPKPKIVPAVRYTSKVRTLDMALLQPFTDGSDDASHRSELDDQACFLAKARFKNMALAT